MAWQDLRWWCGALAMGVLVGCGGDDGGDEGADTSGTQGDDDDDDDGSETSPGSTGPESTGPDGSSTDPDDSGGSETGDESCIDDCNPGGVVIWQAKWETDQYDTTLAAAVGADGRIVIGGGINEPELWPPTDGFFAAWDQDGNALHDEMIGERVYGAVALGVDVVFAGETDAQALWLSRRDPDGASVWDSVDDSGTMTFAGPFIALPNDELFAAGGTDTNGYLAHYDDAGMQITFAQTTTPVYITAAIAVATDVIVLGDDGLGGYWLARMDPDGTTDWERMGEGVPTAMAINEDDEIAITAIVATDMSTYTAIHRWGIDGTMTSDYSIAQGDAVVLDILPVTGGDLIMSGHTQLNGIHCWIVRTDPTNATVWQVIFNQEDAESECRTVDFAPDGTYYAAGSRKSTVEPETGGEAVTDLDAWVMRFDPE